MLQILDPRLPQSYLSEAELSARADNLSKHPSLRMQLDPDSLQELAEKIASDPDTQTTVGTHEIARHQAIMIASRYCIFELMSDGNGRPQDILLSDVARMIHAVRVVATHQHIGALQELVVAQTKPNRKPKTWQIAPGGLRIPSVDGNDPFKERRVTGSNGQNVIVEARNLTWQRQFTQTTIPELTGTYLYPLEPPFVLNSGYRVTTDFPIYYITPSDSNAGFLELPQDFISA